MLKEEYWPADAKWVLPAFLMSDEGKARPDATPRFILAQDGKIILAVTGNNAFTYSGAGKATLTLDSVPTATGTYNLVNYVGTSPGLANFQLNTSAPAISMPIEAVERALTASES